MEERDNTNENIVYPLPYGLKTFILRELHKITTDTDHPLSIIETTIRENKDIYNNLIKELDNHLKMDTKPFVNKIIQYKKKPCRDGINCRRGNGCIFKHANQNKSYADNYERRYTDNNGRNEYQQKNKLYSDYNEKKYNNGSTENNRNEYQQKSKIYADNYEKKYNTEKKFKTMRDDNDLTEIILNNVPIQVTEENLSSYCDQFGFSTIKKLKDRKFLVCFKTNEEARALLYAKEPVLNDENIKKYFNRNIKVEEEDLEQLFENLEEQLTMIQNDTGHEGCRKMQWIINRVKSVIFKRNNNKPREKKSLLCNSNFVME